MWANPTPNILMKKLIIVTAFILLFMLIAPISIDGIRELHTEQVIRETLVSNVSIGSTNLDTFFIPNGQITNSSLVFAVQVHPILDNAFLNISINDNITFSGVAFSGQMVLVNYNAINGINSFRADVSNPSLNFTSLDIFLKHEATVLRSDKVTQLLFILQFIVLLVGVLFLVKILKSGEL